MFLDTTESVLMTDLNFKHIYLKINKTHTELNNNNIFINDLVRVISVKHFQAPNIYSFVLEKEDNTIESVQMDINLFVDLVMLATKDGILFLDLYTTKSDNTEKSYNNFLISKGVLTDKSFSTKMKKIFYPISSIVTTLVATVGVALFILYIINSFFQLGE